MIRYSLKCRRDHSFESWFKSADAFDTLLAEGRVECPDCGSTRVEKAPMAPRVSAKAPEEHPLARLRRKVEAESDYVGTSFASEARAMHTGDSPKRSIWGEAKPEDAKALVEDGVPIAPLPFIPKRKAN
ncbi:DUF1178 family protein [Palleronia abyssalis]|uniref:Uncharacterized protein n=1 Tax=Palleronia abyssalis TaxID=1501240 RepID=A0A2R8BYP1_9RHOB|nr:DUF1178 family protein [Palleronia abyssalis]SPJ25260.1 hypothetical protein PAA8504_03111 [Palleronia abyssalis]